MDWLPWHSRFHLWLLCIFFLSNLVSFSSKCKPVVSCSSVKVEYRVVANVVSEVSYLHSLLFKHLLPSATLVLCNNVSGIFLSSNPISNVHTKHVDIDLHFMHDEHITAGTIKVLHVPSYLEFAHLMTKGLQVCCFMNFNPIWIFTPHPLQFWGTFEHIFSA